MGWSLHTVALTRSSSKDSVSPVNFTEVSFDSRVRSCLAGGHGVGRLVKAGREQEGETRHIPRKEAGCGGWVENSQTVLAHDRENDLQARAWGWGGRKPGHQSKQERGLS